MTGNNCTALSSLGRAEPICFSATAVPFGPGDGELSRRSLGRILFRWISVPHHKIPGTETEPTSLTSHQRFMPSRCDLSREAARRLMSREVCGNRKPREKGGFSRVSAS